MTIRNRPNIINPFAYWVITGSVAAGEYPGSQFSRSIATNSATLIHSTRALLRNNKPFINSSSHKIKNLLDVGIRTFIDLTEVDERPDYRSRLHKERRKRSVKVGYHRFPIKDKQVPSRGQMTDILELIKFEIDENRKVYIHCFRGLGRTGLIVGCLLKEYGLVNTDPLNDIKEMRHGLAGDFRSSPETEDQKRFVAEWMN